jgi:RecA-family ATPase
MSTAAQRGRASALPTTFTATDLLRGDLPPIEQIVRGIVYEGVTVFAGKPKQGKTWLMLAMALDAACGSIALGSRPVKQSGVLYLALEDNQRRLQGRIKKLLAGRGVPEGLYTLPPAGRG